MSPEYASTPVKSQTSNVSASIGTLMGERHIQSGGENDVILFLARRRIGDINVAERVLPA
jgi:hypothetical protein